jgi:CelD/BcsL family acetyltransferase involved in cellulose biosynthesis
VADATFRVLEGFDDSALADGTWDRLAERAPTRTVFLTEAFQRAWWETLGRGRLLLVAAERDGRPVALAPLFAESGMGLLLGSGVSDYLDLLGEAGEAGMLAGLLREAMRAVPDAVGLRLHHVPDASATTAILEEAAERAGLRCFDEGHLEAPDLGIEHAEAAASKRSLRRHERALEREGDLRIEHDRSAAAVLPHLDAFFAQHVARWRDTGSPSPFESEAPRAFFRRLAERGGDAGWLRFTRVVWNGRDVAFHFGFHHAGEFLWYKPSYDPALARRSPGEVLLRHLLLEAKREGARRFDLGLGTEPFKDRFATGRRTVRTWGLYPDAALAADAT